jgi:hypothetical protein
MYNNKDRSWRRSLAQITGLAENPARKYMETETIPKRAPDEARNNTPPTLGERTRDRHSSIQDRVIFRPQLNLEEERIDSEPLEPTHIDEQDAPPSKKPSSPPPSPPTTHTSSVADRLRFKRTAKVAPDPDTPGGTLAAAPATYPNTSLKILKRNNAILSLLLAFATAIIAHTLVIAFSVNASTTCANQPGAWYIALAAALAIAYAADALLIIAKNRLNTTSRAKITHTTNTSIDKLEEFRQRVMRAQDARHRKSSRLASHDETNRKNSNYSQRNHSRKNSSCSVISRKNSDAHAPQQDAFEPDM